MVVIQAYNTNNELVKERSGVVISDKGYYSNCSASNGRSYAKYDLDDYTGAIQDYSKAIEINPNDAKAYIGRGAAKDDLEDYRGAIQDYNKAIEINRNDARAYIVRGLAKLQLGDKDGACLDWSKAGELGDSRAYDMIKQFCK